MLKIVGIITIFFILIFIFFKTDDIYDVKTIVLENLCIERNLDEPLGLRIGGYDDGSGVVIDNITDGGPAFKSGLKLNDKLLEIDGADLENLKYDEVLNLLKCANKMFNLKVSRQIKTFKN